MAGGNIPHSLAPIFVQAGKQYGIPPRVLAGIADIESTFRNGLTSPTGAQGLMQFEPSTAQSVGLKNPWNQQASIFAAAKLLNQYGYQSNALRAIGAYNGGPGNPQYSYANQVMASANRLAPQLAGVPGGGGQVGTGGIAPKPGGGLAQRQGIGQPPRIVPNKAAIVSNYLANEPQINPWNIPIPGTRQTTGTDIPASQNPLLAPGQPLALGQPLTKTIPGHHQALQQAHNRLSKIAGTGLNMHPTLRAGTVAGGFLPKGATYIKQRADQGRDGQTNPGGPILANGNGKVVAVLSDPNGFGPSYPVIAFTTGPYAGRTLYFGHTLSTVKQGQTVRAGQVISHTGTHGVGNATTPGWFEIGFAPGGIPGAFGQPTPF